MGRIGPGTRRLRRVAAALGRAGAFAPVAVQRWWSLPAPDRRTTIRACGILLLVESTIRWVRVPRIAGWLGITVGTGGASRTSSGTSLAGLEPSGSGLATATDPDDLPEALRLARRCTLRVIRPWPFGTGPCLRESLVLGHLARDRSPVLRFGVGRAPEGRIRAHAWVEVDGRAVNDPRGYLPLRGQSPD